MADQCLCLLLFPIVMTKGQRRSNLSGQMFSLAHSKEGTHCHGREAMAARVRGCLLTFGEIRKQGEMNDGSSGSNPFYLVWATSPQDGGVHFIMCLLNTVNAFQKHFFKVSV